MFCIPGAGLRHKNNSMDVQSHGARRQISKFPLKISARSNAHSGCSATKVLRRPAAGRPPTVGGVERTALEGGSGRFGKLAGEWFLLGLGLGLNGREYGAIKECARIAPKEDSQSKEATPTILMFEHFTLFF